MGARREFFRAHAYAVSVAFGGGVILLGALVVASRKTAPPPAKAEADAARPVVDTEANCALIRARYRVALVPLERCTRDDECTVDRMEGVRSGIDGCARYRRVDADLDASVIPFEEAWLARGCSQLFMSCGARRAQCKEGHCAELPPDPVPRTWHRVLHTTRFSFFVPPDLAREAVTMDDDEGGQFEGPRYTLYYELGAYSPDLEGKPSDGDTTLRREATTISGVPANLVVTRTSSNQIRSGVQIPDVPALSREGVRLTLWATCKTEKDCADAPIIARSIELH